MVMLFRPKFCANCGEKIERTEWGYLTSRRFCETCAIEFKGQEMIPRGIVAAGLLVGALGIGSYLNSGEASPKVVQQPRHLADAPQQVTQREKVQETAVPMPAVNAVPPKPQQSKPLSSTKPAAIADEAVYYCGAATKKGTPCSRRVKGNIRCFQHTGMPVMADVSLGKIDH
ncbi:MAG: hypothetical protein LC734_11740 [Acidobacteria bacterium]|nr:hypothetical protein [Acidobacteriota bacterium]